MPNIAVDLPAPAGDGSGAPQVTAAMAPLKTLTVHDPFTGVIAIEFSNDGGATWCEELSFTTPGKRTFELAAEQMRVTRRGVSTGAAPNVDVAAEPGVSMFGTPAVPAGDGAGAALDVSAFGAFNTICVSGPFTGIVVIEISEDGIDWSEIMTFQGPGAKSLEFVATDLRVRRRATSGGAAPVVAVGASEGVGGGASGVAEPRTCFVFRPGDPVGARENVYTDWNALVAAMAVVEGCKEILFDDTFAACQIPAGAYDMAGVTWSGGFPGASAEVTFLAGSTVTNLSRVKDGLTLLSTAGAPSVLLVNGDRLSFENASGCRSTGSSIFDVAAGDTAEIELGIECALTQTGTPAINLNAGSFCGVLLQEPGASLGSDMFTGAGDATAFLRTSAATVNNDQSTIGGTFQIDLEYAENDFIFRPGGNDEGNVYTDWTLLFDAMGSVTGPKRLYLDDSLVTPILVPVGTWDLTDVELIGLHTITLTEKAGGPGSNFQTPVSVAEGAVFTSSAPFDQAGPGSTLQRYVLRNLKIFSSGGGAAAPFTFDSATAFGFIELHNCAFGDPDAGSAGRLVVQNEPAPFVTTLLSDSIVDDQSVVLYDVNGNTQCDFVLMGSSRLNSDVIVTEAASNLGVTLASNDSDVQGTFSGISGSLATFQRTSALYIPDPLGSGTIEPGEVRTVDTGGGPVAVNLPASSRANEGRPFTIIKNTAEAVNALSFNPAGTDTVKGANSTTSAFGSITVVDLGDGTFAQIAGT